MEQMCRMEPIYNRRSTRMDVIFRAGDFRSTLDDREMAKASRAQEEGSIGDEPYAPREVERTQPRSPFCKPGGVDECNASLLPGSWRGR